MYAGQVVETGDAKDIFRAPRHPTQALLRAAGIRPDKARLASLPGVVPGNMTVPTAACLIRAAPMPRINAVAKSRRSRI